VIIRSSTNCEDLPGFNGAGLYESVPLSSSSLSLAFSLSPTDTHHPLKRAIKEVYASMWRYRAFSERDMFHLDHRDAEMGKKNI
jgi:pyruvate,water dikinase